MAYYLNNIELPDAYQPAATLGPFDDADTCTVLVSGNPAAMQFHIGRGTQGRWTDEREFVAAAGAVTTNSFKVANVNGIRLRNYNAGETATISVTLFRTGVAYDSADPIFDAGSLSPGAITSTGNVSNPAGTVKSGFVNADGTIGAGTGFNVSKFGTGEYELIFTNVFSGPYFGISVELEGVFGRTRTSRVNASTIQVVIDDDTGTPLDAPFSFMVNDAV